MSLIQQYQDLGKSKSVFLQLEKKQITYKELIERIGRIGTLFQSHGISRGDSILLSVEDPYDLASLLLASLLSGINAVVLDARFKSQKANSILGRLNLKGWVVDRNLEKVWDLPQQVSMKLGVEQAKKAKKSLVSKLLRKKSNVTQSEQTLDSLVNDLDKYEFSAVASEQVAYTLFTSGSSAMPKGVEISHGNLEVHLITLANQYELTAQSKILNILPVFHTDGLIQGPVLSFFAGATWSRPVCFEISNIPDVLNAVYKYQISHFLTVPTMMNMLLQFSQGYEDSFQTGEFKYVVSSASILEKQLWEAFENKFSVKVSNVYGLTETVAGSLFSGPKEETRKVGAIGRPVDCSVKLIDNDGQEVEAPGQNGELCLKGNHITKSYLGVGNPQDSEGWFHTGDLAHKDSEGFYFLVGRKSNLIISGGVNISPEEVEEVIKQLDSVKDACAFGLPDEIQGEKVGVAIVLSAQLEENIIRTHCAQFLEENKMPSQYFFLKAFPQTNSGKVDRKKVFDEVQSLQQIGEDGESDISDRVISIAKNTFHFSKNQVDIYAPSQQVAGWTSLNHLDFVVKLEKAFEVQLSTTDIMNITSVNDAISIIREKV